MLKKLKKAYKKGIITFILLLSSNMGIDFNLLWTPLNKLESTPTLFTIKGVVFEYI